MAEYTSIVTYKEVKKCGTDKNVLIIDVREPKELEDTGTIPGSINIPLGEIEKILSQMSDEEFLKKYGREKPKKDTRIIFSCQKGGRSTKAFQAAEKLGFTRVENYKGGFQDWAANNK